MKTKIHQIFYRESQKDFLDPAFLPYNNEGKSYPYNFEYAVFFDLYKKTDWSHTDLLGTVSWKFQQKTGLTGQVFLDNINANPGYDVYFVNPFPELCIYRSVWDHGEEFHPRLKEITGKLFQACGYDTRLLEHETPPNLTAYCNYWVGSKNFWDEYIAFLTPIWEYAHQGNEPLSLELRKMADPFIKAPYLPFLFERLFSTFLTKKRFKTRALPAALSKISENPYLSPISSQVLRVSQLDNHNLVSWPDKVAIEAFSLVRKWRHYHLPLAIKRLSARFRNEVNL